MPHDVFSSSKKWLSRKVDALFRDILDTFAYPDVRITAKLFPNTDITRISVNLYANDSTAPSRG